MRRIPIVLLPVGLWIGWAQSPQPPTSPQSPMRAPVSAAKKEPFKNLAPVSKDVLKVKLPKAQEVQLENGMTVLILEDHRLPQIFISMDIRGGGGLLDPVEMKGLAGLSA